MTAVHSVAPLDKKLTTEELVARASALVPSLRERAERIAQNRCQPADVIQDIHDAGLMELMRPMRFGGHEYGVDAVVRVGCELAKGDASTSWAYMVTAAHDAFMPLFPEKVQAEFWNSAKPVGASSYVPTGKATPAEGGYTLTGKWSFCSGIDQSGWVLLGGIVGMLPEGGPDLRFFMIPDSDFEIVDDWNVMGLRGTGSKSVVVKEAFVPYERMIDRPQIKAGVALPPSDITDPNYRESVWVAVAFSLAGVAAGAARAAYDYLVGELRAKAERGDPMFAAKRPAVQLHLGEASVMLNISESLLHDSIDRVIGKMRANERLTDAERVRNRRDICYSVVMAKKSVDVLMGMSGGHGIMEGHPVQRALRDIYAISAHPGVNWDSPAMSFGNVELGGLPTEPHI